MIGTRVFHDIFGDGVITGRDGNLITVDFGGVEKKFIYPDAFEGFLISADKEFMAQVKRDILVNQEARAKAKLSEPHLSAGLPEKPRRKKKRKMVERSNVAFKCNYCDGGKASTCIGFNGVCSDSVLRYNIEKAKHVWCSDADSPCRWYYDGEIVREDLEEMMFGGDDSGYVCYESQMLRDWRAFAGYGHNGARKGKPLRLMQVQRNSLAALTTRDPNYTDEYRYIFAVFLVDESYEGDHREAGYVTTRSDWKISLTPQEARKIRFWNYYVNMNAPEKIVFGSGLFRYLSDNQAAQILRDISEVRTAPKDKDFARRFFEHFCRINGVDPKRVPPPAGALRRNK